jgi:hypothetical protein
MTMATKRPQDLGVITFTSRSDSLNRDTADKLGRTAGGSPRHSTKAENVSKAASILQMNDLELGHILQIDDQTGTHGAWARLKTHLCRRI